MSSAIGSVKWRTWIEIDTKAANANVRIFRRLIGKRVKLWAVIKSNAYGHGLTITAQTIERVVDGFCVDSVVEGFHLRKIGITKPILVLGLTLPVHLASAADNDITITIPSFDAFLWLRKEKTVPAFHIKLDTGMHRQGFFATDVKRVAALIKKEKRLREKFTGVYTHFASAKDVAAPAYTDIQLAAFMQGVTVLRKIRPDILAHAAATGGALLDRKYHCDAVRIGMGLHGMYPAPLMELQLPGLPFKPVLSWKTIVGEVKPIERGAFIGYDCAERMPRKGKIAILPIGYWHGYPRALSHIGEVLIRGTRAKVLGKVSMDLLVVDVTNIPATVGDTVTIIGSDRSETISAYELAGKAGTTPYELLTRINPKIHRILV